MSSRIPYLAIIPARGGSKRVPRKNLISLGGKPLITYTIEAALAAVRLTQIIVSTDDEEIARTAKTCNVEVPFLRPPDLARDKSQVLDALLHTLLMIEKDEVIVDAVVLLQPTSPFRTGQHIDESIALFESSGADTVTAVTHAREHPYYAWTTEGDHLVPFFSMEEQMTLRQDLPPALMENGSIYVIRRSVVAGGSIYGSKIVPYIMEEVSSVDINTQDDLSRAEFLLSQKECLKECP